MIFTQLIKANLETRVLGQEIAYFVRVASTNTEAMELLEEGVPEGTVVVTDNQTAGRGRHHQSWFSGPGKGLAFSVILKPELTGRVAGVISLMGAVAASEAIERFHLSPTVKWPNDILLSGRKCGGILVDTRFQGNTMGWAIMGIGVNVNETAHDFPEEFREGSISILMAKESPAQRELALAWILNSLEQWYDRLKSEEFGAIISAWKRRCNHLGEKVLFTRKGKTQAGIFTDVTERGEAVIRHDSGEVTLSSEEIYLIRPA
ncbi:MAG: biotin--[acetyl-CoA-carboxylase] ligase [Fidelibacterota bacterium]